MYGWGHNEDVLGRALKGGYRDKAFLATKFGQIQREGPGNGVNGRPEYVMQACDASLKRLGADDVAKIKPMISRITAGGSMMKASTRTIKT